MKKIRTIAAKTLTVLMIFSLIPSLQVKAFSGEDPLLEIESDLEITHIGTGRGMVGITGDPRKEYDLLLRIARGGAPGDMSVQVSLDNGSFWSEEQEITLAGNLPLYERKDGKKEFSGLTAHFSVQDPADPETFFQTGDEFRAFAMDPADDIVIDLEKDGRTMQLRFNLKTGKSNVEDVIGIPVMR